MTDDTLPTTSAVADRNTAMTNPQAALFAAANLSAGQAINSIDRIFHVSDQFLTWLNNADNRNPADG